MSPELRSSTSCSSVSGVPIYYAAIAATIVVAVSEISQRYPRGEALLLTRPFVSVLTFLMSWQQYHDVPAISRMAQETLILVPLGLPFFLPLAFANRLGWGFWPAFLAGLTLATGTIGLWMCLAPNGN